MSLLFLWPFALEWAYHYYHYGYLTINGASGQTNETRVPGISSYSYPFFTWLQFLFLGFRVLLIICFRQ
jgi:hypothetical protein